MSHYSSADNTATKLEPMLASPAAPHDKMVGACLLGRYRLEDVLGEGGSSVIYRGVHTTIGRTVAIKMLRPELVRNEETVARFLREGRAQSRVRHEHVAEATDFGVTPEGDVFLVMEYLEGEDLAELLDREGALPWPRARAIALQICEAIEAAHAAGVIHRDITLQNCFRVHRERNPDYVKVIDFGIAKMETGSPETDECGVTDNAEIFGTPEYMAPEQVRRTIDADWRTDVYALGAVLYALVTGRLPLRGATALDTLVRQIYEDVVPPSKVVTGIPAQLEAAILRALSKDPDARFQSMSEFATALEHVPVLGLVDRSAPMRADELDVLDGPVTVTDLDLPQQLVEHDIRDERPAEHLIGRPSRPWFEKRWPMAAVAACALAFIGWSVLDRDPRDESSRPTSMQASAVVGNALPSGPETAPAQTSPAIERASLPTTMPEQAIAAAVPTTSPTKASRVSRRGTGRRAEAESALDPAVPSSAPATPAVEDGTLPAPVEAVEPDAHPTDTGVDAGALADAAAPSAAPPVEPQVATVPHPPTPDPFAHSERGEEIKDPFGSSLGASQ